MNTEETVSANVADENESVGESPVTNPAAGEESATTGDAPAEEAAGEVKDIELEGDGDDEELTDDDED